MGECNICLGFRFQVFPHFPQGKLSERNTRVLVKLPRAGEARHVAPVLRLVILTRSRIFRSLLSSLRKYLWSISVSSSCWSLRMMYVVFPGIWSSMIAGRIFLNSDWKSNLLNPLQGSEVWYHHRSDDRKYVCASQATFATAIVTKIVLQRWTRLAFATELIFIVVYTLDGGISLSGWTPRKIHSIKTKIH